MKVTSVFASCNFKLILEFDEWEYRLLDIKKFLKDDSGLLAGVRDDLNMFRTAKNDGIAGTISFHNGVDFDPTILHEASESIDHVFKDDLFKRNRDLDKRETSKVKWKEIEYKGAAKVLVSTIAHNLVLEEDVSIDVVARALGLNEETVEEFIREWDLI